MLLKKLIIIFILMSNINANENIGVKFSIEMFGKMPKLILSQNIKIDNDKSLIKFASKLLYFSKDDLRVIRYQNYIIIHYENEQYIKKHPKWNLKKYGEAVVIDKNNFKYCWFRLSRT